jgi:hypothetical protein
MKKNKQLNLGLFPPVTSPSIREIQMATKGIDLFDFSNRFKIVEIVARCYGVDNIMKMNPATKGMEEFVMQCYNDAFLANSAYNPDRGS